MERVQEHQQESRAKGVYWHIKSCPAYAEKRKIFSSVSSWKTNFEFFKSHFKILQKSFRSDFERLKTEAFYIRTKRPDLNDQKDHNFLKLF